MAGLILPLLRPLENCRSKNNRPKKRIRTNRDEFPVKPKVHAIAAPIRCSVISGIKFEYFP